MARYANHECAGCGRILPAYELAEVSDRVETGVSRHEHRIGHSPHFRHTGTTRRYANRVKRLCMRCRVNRFVGKVIVTGAAGFAFLAFASNDNKGVPASTPASSSGALLQRAAGLADQAGAAVASLKDQLPHEADLSERAGAETGNQAASVANTPPPDAKAELAEQIISAPETVEQVEEAVQRALERGKAVRWKAHKLRGFAVPSEPAANGCRMVQISIDHGAQGAAFQRCPAGGQEQEL